MTFSIAAVCEKTGETGCAVSSSSICVTSRCAFVGDGGAVLTQNVTNPSLGIKALRLLQEGFTPQEALDRLLLNEPYPQWRQLLIVDRYARTAAFDGDKALGIVGKAKGGHCIAAGNLLAKPDVPQAMVAAFEASQGALAERLIKAMEAGLAAGGEAGPVYSSGVKVARPGFGWPIVDLRIDWRDAPINELRLLWEQYAGQMEDYLMRAKNPNAAPSYGVPGE
ncbi:MULTISPECIES: DUF1028 domain-containing protein [Halomonadaceae]|uniref:DUF1028 domain-containing protein n=2 Tax=Vreelandella TaxID=3137766 RepID=A0A7Z0LWW7_9GAMM|nr:MULTISPECIES: DUF1028 domain-containing protein [Halomonas]NYS79930.1 DUF1028 domain-containing protein [Halomonas glaciei]|tara:strand:- start:13209 stop:13877 length:669 start_codon:yes stop_codon:yes gene_type:complete